MGHRFVFDFGYKLLAEFILVRFRNKQRVDGCHGPSAFTIAHRETVRECRYGFGVLVIRLTVVAVERVNFDRS